VTPWIMPPPEATRPGRNLQNAALREVGVHLRRFLPQPPLYYRGNVGYISSAGPKRPAFAVPFRKTA
jgi:hypothetical protein